MSLPGVLLLFIFAYLPMLGIVIAFKDYRFNLGILGSEWVGFQNFRFLFGTDAAFRITRNTLLMNLLFISTITICALTVAILMNEAYRSRMSKYYQTIAVLPLLHFVGDCELQGPGRKVRPRFGFHHEVGGHGALVGRRA